MQTFVAAWSPARAARHCDASPRFYWTCVVLDMLVTFVAAVGLLVLAAAVAYKAVWVSATLGTRWWFGPAPRRLDPARPACAGLRQQRGAAELVAHDRQLRCAVDDLLRHRIAMRTCEHGGHGCQCARRPSNAASS